MPQQKSQTEREPKRVDQPEAALAAALALDLAALGYPGFAHLRALRRRRDPAKVLWEALSQPELESRLVEALPWVLLNYSKLNWRWLSDTAQRHGLQNRLGFITNLAQQLAVQRGEAEKAAILARAEAALERSRLLREDTLCHASLTDAERCYLREHRPTAARHWRLLTDLKPEHLAYAAV